MDLADFPNLKELDLDSTAVTGDIRDISENDFSSLEELILPHGAYGVSGYKLQRISDGPELIRAVYLLSKQRPALMDMDGFLESYRKILLSGMTLRSQRQMFKIYRHSTLYLFKRDLALDIDGQTMSGEETLVK